MVQIQRQSIYVGEEEGPNDNIEPMDKAELVQSYFEFEFKRQIRIEDILLSSARHGNTGNIALQTQLNKIRQLTEDLESQTTDGWLPS